MSESTIERRSDGERVDGWNRFEDGNNNDEKRRIHDAKRDSDSQT
jgi:hypothetical protein